MLNWVSLFLILTQSQVYYHFGSSFGQIYRDRMYNSNKVAISGETSSIDSHDIIPTDRGAYIHNYDSGIRLYPNDASNEAILINGSFTLAFWFKPDSFYSGYIFTRYGYDQYLVLYTYSEDSYYRIYYCNFYYYECERFTMNSIPHPTCNL